MGRPSMTSSTTSWRIRIASGYARATRSPTTTTTAAFDPTQLTALAGSKDGVAIAGTSLGDPTSMRSRSTNHAGPALETTGEPPEHALTRANRTAIHQRFSRSDARVSFHSRLI